MLLTRFCPRCGATYLIQSSVAESKDKCPACNGEVNEIFGITVNEYVNNFDKQKFFADHNIHPVISEEDAQTIMDATNKNEEILNAMIDLKQKDIIEYGIKLAQFKPAAEAVDARRKEKLEQERQERIREMNQPKCPRCGSTQIQTVPRKWSLMTGFLTNKVDRVCMNCKHKF